MEEILDLNSSEITSSTNNIQLRKLLTLAVLTGSVMLKSGAETYRVEDTIKRICKSRLGIRFVHCFVIPSAIFVSIDYEGELISYLKRVSGDQINLNKVHLINRFSRNFVNSNMSVEKGLEIVDEINDTNLFTRRQFIFFAGIVAGTFTGMFGAGILDMLLSFIVGMLTMKFIYYIYKFEFSAFINNYAAGFLTAFLSYIVRKLGLTSNMDLIIIGGMMPMLPGYALTNAIRDAITGENISSLSRGLEAILCAVALAIGVATVLKII